MGMRLGATEGGGPRLLSGNAMGGKQAFAANCINGSLRPGIIPATILTPIADRIGVHQGMQTRR